MPKFILASDLGRLINASDTPLPTLIESILVLAEDLQADHLGRENFWGRLFDSAARGNPLARDLCQRETAWLCSRKNIVGDLHSRVQYLHLMLRDGGHLTAGEDVSS